jgi:type IV pilus assembly protein PilC
MATTTATSFVYEALDPTGKVVKGTIDADSEEGVAQILSVRKLSPTTIKPAGTGLQREITLPGIGNKTKAKDLAVFTRQFASMTSAGLTLLRALAILQDQVDKPGLKKAVRQVKAAVQHGSTLSGALAEHPDHFPDLMVNMIKAGETGGFLDEALRRIADMYEADSQLRAKIKGAMTYPVIVLCFSLILGTGVIIFIVPVFEGMFDQFGGTLPLPTRILVALSHSAFLWAPAMIVVLVGGMAALRKAYRTRPPFRLAVDRMRLKVPVFGKLFTKIAISRWARNFGTLLQVGVPALQALQVVGGTTGNAVITEAMEDLRVAVRQGRPMSEPLARQDVFPPMVVQMVEVGEETGQLTEMLDKTAEYYDYEVKTLTESLTAAMEPLLVVILGATIGSMVLALYLPMFTVYQNIAQ